MDGFFLTTVVAAGEIDGLLIETIHALPPFTWLRACQRNGSSVLRAHRDSGLGFEMSKLSGEGKRNQFVLCRGHHDGAPWNAANDSPLRASIRQP